MHFVDNRHQKMSRVQKVMTQPVNVIFSMLRSVRAPACARAAVTGAAIVLLPSAENKISFDHFSLPSQHTPALQKQRVSVWLYENTTTRLEGRIAVSMPSAGGGANLN